MKSNRAVYVLMLVLSLTACMVDMTSLLFWSLFHRPGTVDMVILVCLIICPISIIKINYDMHHESYRYSLLRNRSKQTIVRAYTAFALSISVVNIATIIVVFGPLVH